MKYIDLSHTISNDTKVSPYDEKPVLIRTKHLEVDHYNDTLLHSTMHIGTHVDAPSHMLDNTSYINEFPIQSFIGKGAVLDFTNQQLITLREQDKAKIKKDSIVIIHTGMYKEYGSDNYYHNHPKVTEELCDYLIQQEVRMLVLDFFSPDSIPSIIHKKLLSQNILITENVVQTEKLLDIPEFEMFIIPIKIKAEGAFVRAFARY